MRERSSGFGRSPMVRLVVAVTAIATSAWACSSNTSGDGDGDDVGGGVPLFDSNGPANNWLIKGGDGVITVNEGQPRADAMWVQNGMIKKVGSLADVTKAANAKKDILHPLKTVTLEAGQVVMPGFVEPHMHLSGFVMGLVMQDVSPCLPQRYESRTSGKECFTNVIAALKNMNKTDVVAHWVMGNGLDPSRMSLAGENAAPSDLIGPNDDILTFINNPAPYLDKHVTDKSPVYIVDASGHVAYANMKAYAWAGLCNDNKNATECPPNNYDPDNPGKYQPADYPGSELKVEMVDGHWRYTGRALEAGAISMVLGKNSTWNYLNVKMAEHLESVVQEIPGLRTIPQKIGRKGVTTFMNGGAFGGIEVSAAGAMATWPLFWHQGSNPVRVRNLKKWDSFTKDGKELPFKFDDFWSSKNNGMFGDIGVKLWADGSTQGCSANLNEPYSLDGICAEAKKGHKDMELSDMIKALTRFWKANTLVHIHANGDAAQEMALNAMATMQLDAGTNKNTQHPTLIHFTVTGAELESVDRVRAIRAGEYVISAGPSKGKTAPPVNVAVTNLIGHVAYWGGSLQQILDGEFDDPHGRAATMDPGQSSLAAELPYSAHSDYPVSPIGPLNYVEQLVTRNTWVYPNLLDSQVQKMPGDQGITRAQALRAVTLGAASQLMLDKEIGSIEEGKVADLVVLGGNPLTVDADKIHAIRVVRTFVNGNSHEWKVENCPGQPTGDWTKHCTGRTFDKTNCVTCGKCDTKNKTAVSCVGPCKQATVSDGALTCSDAQE
jgi:predicted amidohydrolase YtcJ